MLSPSSLSSTSLEQNSSTTASASFFAPSECSNSGCLSISSPDPDNFSNNNGISTTNQTSSPENRMYEYETTTKASSSSVPFPSVSNISPSPPLLLHNPCFQSLTFQRRQSNHHSTPVTSYFGGNGSYGFKTLNSLQNLQLTTDNNTDASSASLLRVVSAKRTISLQQVLHPIPIVDDKRWSFASSSDFPTNRPQNGHNGCKSHSQFVAATHIGHQSAAVMDWLVDMSLSHIMKLFPQAQANDGSTRLYRHVQQAAVTLRGKFHQILGRGAHNDGGHHFPNAVSSDCRHQLFGVPLAAVQANTADGNPLPQFVHDLMDYIAKYAGDTELAEGIFRKSGAKGRIQEIMECCSTLSPSQPLPRHLLDDRQTQLTDLCDVLKKYFYQLPERLFTDRISQLLEEVVNELPAERHFQALHYCILLLPAENREALTTLLEFLSRIARHSKVTRMESQSLARCWCPALFHSSISAESSKDKENGTISRRLTRRKTVGMLNEKALRAIEPFSRLLARMIDDWDRLLRLPRGLESKVAAKGMSICYDLAVPLKKGQFEFTEEMHSNFRRQLFRLKENYFGGWTSWELRRVFPDGSQLFVRPINDMIPLKCFRVQMSVAAPPNLILAAILNRRNVWDPNIASCKRMGPSGQHFDIVRLQYKSPCGRAGQEKCTFLARRWTYAELDVDKICSLVECSIVPREDDGSGKCCWGHVSVYESKFLIVPLCPGHSQLSYISRTDFKGKPSGWYDRVYGEMLAHQMRRLKKCLLKCKSKYGGATVV